MKLTELTVQSFIEEVASKSPAPGGGSVSALASSMGVALTRMVGALSVHKKKFKALDEEIQTSFISIIESFEGINNQLTVLIDKDTEAFNLIMSAFKLPKETEEEKTFRKGKIEEGTLVAIKVPMEVATLCLEAVSNLDYIVTYGNKNTLSDIGVSALMLYAGLEGAILNVKINIPGLSDEQVRNTYLQDVQELLFRAKNLKDDILVRIHEKL